MARRRRLVNVVLAATLVTGLGACQDNGTVKYHGKTGHPAVKYSCSKKPKHAGDTSSCHRVKGK